MENGNNILKKVLIPGIIVIIIIVAVIIYFLINNNSNNGKNNTGGNLNSELKSATMYVTKGDDAKHEKKIVALNDTGKEVQIYKLSKYEDTMLFEVVDKRMYSVIVTASNVTFGYIDLDKGDGKYDFVKIKETGTKKVNDFYFTAINNKLYYQYKDENSIYEYDIVTAKENKIVTCTTNCGLINSTGKSSIAYYKDNDAYIFDTSNNQEIKIDVNATIYFSKGNDIVYSIDDANTTDTVRSVYQYNVVTKEKKLLFNASLGTSEQALIPYKDGYLYVGDNKLYSFTSNSISTIYEFNNKIEDVSFVSNDLVLIGSSSPCDNLMCYETVGLNLTNKKIIDNNDYKAIYYIDTEYVNE